VLHSYPLYLYILNAVDFRPHRRFL